MARAEFVRDRGVILRSLVLVADQQADRGPGGAPFMDAGEDLDRIGFAPLGDVTRTAGLAPVQFLLDIGGRKR